MNLLRILAPASLLAISVITAACGSDSSEPKRTDVAQIDAVIDVVEALDRQALRDLLQFTSIPCTDQPGVPGQPRCLGEAPGTSVDVFQANECEPAWVRREGINKVLDDVLALEPVVFAAFESPENFYVEGRYAVIFEGDEPRVDEAGLKRYVAMGIEADNGLITGLALGCGIDEPVHFLLPHLNEGFDNWLIEPAD